MRLLKIISFITITSIFTGCKDEVFDFNPNISISEHKSGFNHAEITHVEVIGSYDHPIFSEFIDNNQVSLSSDTKYIFLIPIRFNNSSNIILDGNGAIISFPFNGKGIEVINSSSINIRNLRIENTDDSGQRYYSNPEEGRLNILDSDRIVLDSLYITEQGSTPDNSLNHIQINIYNSTSCEVLNSTVKKSHGELIVADGSNDCKIINNKTYNGWSGIATKGRILEWYRGYRTIIESNYVYGTSTASITVNDRQTTVTNNLIEADSLSNTGGPGIRFGHYKDALGNELGHLRAMNCLAESNTILNFLSASGSGGSSATGIKVDATVSTAGYGSISIQNNRIENCNSGISVSNAPGQSGEIINNTINATAISISIFSSDANNLADFSISNNVITSKGENYINGNEYAIRLFRSHGNLNGNTITLNSSNPYARAIDLKENTIDSRVNIIDNILNVNGNYGIHHYNGELNESIIRGNIINHSRVGMLLKTKNSLIDGNIINDAKEYGILFWDGAQNSHVTNNYISVSFSAAIRLHNTNSITVEFNEFELLAGSSLYSVYKSAYNYNPIIQNNLHNWPNQSN